MDIRYTQALLGHVKLETTSLYAQVSIRELKRLHSALHPAARLHGPARASEADPSSAVTAREPLEVLDDEVEDDEFA